jgi:hypothetical protein
MTPATTAEGRSRNLILAATIFAVSMTFIDQTIISIAAPHILFFGIAGALTAVGPAAGGYLIEWTWPAIFWVNIPVALIALALIAVSRPETAYRPARMDYRGVALIVAGVGLGFVAAAQVGGRMLDRVGAKAPVVAGCALAAAGLWLWAVKMTDLSLSAQAGYVIVAGAGMGLMLGPANTDAVNQASHLAYGEATGITQAVATTPPAGASPSSAPSRSFR